MSENRWAFLKNSDGAFDGFNDAGIEYFAGHPYSSLAREIIQNSLDARKSRSKPVKVYFDLIEVHRKRFPDHDGLKNGFQKALKQAKDLDDKTAASFFENALKNILSKDKILCLRIADSNTIGLEGPCDLKKPFFAFLKASGQSIKTSEDAGGSFGIGKNAPYAISDLHCVLVSTDYGKSAPYQQLAQGKVILMSHLDGEGRTISGKGYYGNPDQCLPIHPNSKIPLWMRREKQFATPAELRGTSIFIAGFRSRESWQNILTASIISNYFCAICENNLEVQIEDGKRVININRETLFDLFDDNEVRQAAKSEEIDDLFDLAKNLARCQTGIDVKTEESELSKALGLCRVRILVQDGLNKRVGLLRNGMLVTDRLKNLRQFPGFSDFVAIVDFLSPAGNAFLRNMENPEHNNFEPDRFRDPKKIAKARGELKKLADFVRRSLQRHAQAESGAVTSLDEMSEFFQDLDDEEIAPQKDDGETNPEAPIKLLASPQKKQSSPPPGAEQGNGTGDGGGSGGDGSGNGSGSGSGGNRSNRSRRIPIHNVRCLYSPEKPKYREIFFTPIHSGRAELVIEDFGADVTYPLTVRKVKGGGKVKKGKICELNLRASKRVRLKVTFDREFEGALRVTANEI